VVRFLFPADASSAASGDWFVSDGWYSLGSAGHIGPLSLQELKKTLAAFRNARDVLVWREGLPAWKRAGDFPEFKDKAPLSPLQIGSRRDENRLSTADPRLRFYARMFFGFRIAYFIAYLLSYMIEVSPFLLRIGIALEIGSYVNFLFFVSLAFQQLAFKWLWVILAFVVGFIVPGAITFLITSKLSVIAAPYWATLIATQLITLAVGGCIYVWSINQKGG
jgi:hypothetical protein